MRSPRARLTDIARGYESEGVRLLLMSFYLLLVITCYTATKAVRDSLFIIEVGPAQLPVLYMLIAGSMAVISLIYPRALRKLGLYALVQVTSGTSAQAVVRVVNGNGQPVQGATVGGSWTGLAKSTSTAMTDANGNAVLTSKASRKKGTFTIAVTSVTRSGYTYNAGANAETTKSIAVP